MIEGDDMSNVAMLATMAQTRPQTDMQAMSDDVWQ